MVVNFFYEIIIHANIKTIIIRLLKECMVRVHSFEVVYSFFVRRAWACANRFPVKGSIAANKAQKPNFSIDLEAYHD